MTDRPVVEDGRRVVIDERPGKAVVIRRDAGGDQEHRRGLVDHWLHPIREVYHEHRQELDGLETRVRLDRLCELNVIRQVRNVASDVFVQDAWARGQALCVHGWVYSIANGLVKDLEVSVASPNEIERLIRDVDR